MSGHRPERIAELIHDALARALREEIRDPRIGFVTLTGVQVSPDLRHARVYVSTLDPSAERSETLAALEHATPFLRRSLARHAGLKYVPKLEFLNDESLETGSRVEELIERIHETDGDADPDR